MSLCSKLFLLSARQGPFALPFSAGKTKGPLTPSQFQGQGARTFWSTRHTEEDWHGLEGHENVEFLNDNTLESAVNRADSILVMFYAPWCIHCKNAKPEFAKAAAQLAWEKPSAKIAAVNCVKCMQVKEKFGISGYPTINYWYQGKLLGEYHRGRRASDIVDFMKKEPKSRNEL